MKKRFDETVVPGKTIRPEDAPEEAWVKDIEVNKKIYEMWHQKEPLSLKQNPWDPPKYALLLGRATYIVYKSDKWEDDGDVFPYEHDHESGPRVFAGPRACTLLDVEPISVRKFDPAKLAACDLDNPALFTVLGTVVQLSIYVDADHTYDLAFNKRSTLLCSTPDLRGLIVMLPTGKSFTPVFIRGGEMRVTERGIVK